MEEVEEMSTSNFPETGRIYGLQRVCRVWGITRSTVYNRRSKRHKESTNKKRGPVSKYDACMEFYIVDFQQIVVVSI